MDQYGSGTNTWAGLPRDRPTTHRADLDGLRALAVILVVGYHIWLGRVSGGVDVFLMLSAFFLTSSFARKLETGRALDLAGYWIKTFKRLFSVSAVVLLGVLLAAYLVYAPSEWPAIWSQIWASLGYYQNWQLAADAVDYYARDGALPSPLQHYWSLAIQGQVFLLWPLLIAGIGLVARALRRHVRPALLLTFLLVLAGSLTFSIVETAGHQQLAYFDTRTRLWEFALGSVVALVLPWVRLPRVLGAALAWTGVAAIVACGLVLDVQGGFPGYLALWPTLATAAVVVGGAGDPGAGPGRLLSHRALQELARDSYAVYLVHWPVLIVWRRLHDGAQPGLLTGLGIVVVTLVAARVLTRYVEAPLRTWPVFSGTWRRGVVAAIACLALVAAPTATWAAAERARSGSLVAGLSEQHPGALALLPDAPDVEITAPPIPSGVALDEQWVHVDDPCTGDAVPSDSDVAKACVEYLPDREPELTIAVVGDSHTEQFAGALLPLAEAESWRVVFVLLGGCSFNLADSSCLPWNTKVAGYLRDLSPDAVYTVVTRTEPSVGEDLTVDGQQQALDELHAAGVHIIGVRDNPRFHDDPYLCAEQRGAGDARCSTPRDEALAPDNPALPMLASYGGTAVDFSDLLCPEGMCSPVVGNVYVYMDTNHLTWDYARTMAQALDHMLRDWYTAAER